MYSPKASFSLNTVCLAKAETSWFFLTPRHCMIDPTTACEVVVIGSWLPPLIKYLLELKPYKARQRAMWLTRWGSSWVLFTRPCFRTF